MNKYLKKIFHWIYSTQCDHRVGKVEIDESGLVYSFCPICDKKLTLENKTLDELDKMTVQEVAELMPKDSSIDDLIGMGERLTLISKGIDLSCTKCKSRMNISKEPRMMEVRGITMEMYECPKCGEREYKKASVSG